MADTPLISLPLRDIETYSRPRFPVPRGAWDTHVHIFGPIGRYPHVPQPRYTLPEGSLAQCRRVMVLLGIERFVLIQPSFYGTDNSCLLDALSAAHGLARGVVMVDPDVSDQELAKFHACGVRGIRLDLFRMSEEPLAIIHNHIRLMSERARSLGWHLQFYVPGALVHRLADFLATLPIDFVLDHMGYPTDNKSATQVVLADLLDSPHCYVKLSGVYRLGKYCDAATVDELAQRLIARAPARVIWGSDWPHISFADVDTGELVSLLERWAPEASIRRRILADNPRRLFGESAA